MHEVKTGSADTDEVHALTYAGRHFREPIPKYELPARGMSADAAYQLVHDELHLDGNPVLNLASFVTTWMEPQADRLAIETLNKNMIDQDEYPQTEAIHQRVINMLGRLFNAPAECTPVGTATVGSSEAIMLGLLAHKHTWRKRRQAAGLPVDRPNVVMGGDVHTCWEKFARYFDVEARVAPLSPDRYTLSGDQVRDLVDENTIAVGALVGTTFTGQMDDLADINQALTDIHREKGWFVPLHIDAASGGFIVPFTRPELAWDFRLSQVRSINVSNHKFGLVYPGMGSVIFRDRSDLPEELIFHINYLGGDMPNYSLNFSRPSNVVILQYYNFLRLGRAGYEEILSCLLETARYLAQGLCESGRFISLNDAETFPIVVVRAADPEGDDVFALSEQLRLRGWIIPAYTLPPNAQEVAVLRMVVKENFSRDMAEMLVDDFAAALEHIAARHPAARPRRHRKRQQPVC
jgi:glutamate decarboxylase